MRERDRMRERCVRKCACACVCVCIEWHLCKRVINGLRCFGIEGRLTHADSFRFTGILPVPSPDTSSAKVCCQQEVCEHASDAYMFVLRTLCIRVFTTPKGRTEQSGKRCTQ